MAENLAAATPHWLGYLFQRPESHRVHHQFRHHANNFMDLPIWDILFNTFKNPSKFRGRCGYEEIGVKIDLTT